MRAVLVIGSNYGDREKTIVKAFSFLQTLGTIIEKSPIYETPDCLGSGNKYLNAVVRLDTELNETDVNSKIKAFEIHCGRNLERRKRGEVPMDIDVVIWEDNIRRATDFKSGYFRKGYNSLKES